MSDYSGPSIRLKPEEEAVLLCAQAERDPTAQEKLDRLLADDNLDWGLFWDHAARQQIVPLVSRTLTSAALAGNVPEHGVADAKAARARTIVYNRSVHAELNRLGAAFHDHGIPVVPLKGTHLAERVYGSLEARQVGDIDILVREAQLDEARSILRANGYEQFLTGSSGLDDHPFHAAPWVRMGSPFNFVVELHWNLNDPRFVTVDYRRLWDRILDGRRADVTLPALPAEELLVFLALHLFKHDAGLLRLLADVDRLVRREGPNLDWSRVTALAHSWSAAGPLYFTLHRARYFFDTPVPEETLRRVIPPRWKRGFVNLLIGPSTILHPSESLHRRSSRARLAYCAMLSPATRAVKAYVHYLFPSPSPRHAGGASTIRDVCRRIVGGLARTSLVLASSLVER